MTAGAGLSASTGAAAAQTLALSSFTPAANSLVVVAASAIRDGHSNGLGGGWAITGSGYTWTAAGTSVLHEVDDLNGADPTFAQQVQVWTAEAGASPSAVTVTVDAESGGTNGFYYAIAKVEVPAGEFTPGSPVAQIDFAPTTSADPSEPITITHSAASGGQRAALFFEHTPASFTWDSDPTNWASITGTEIATAVGCKALSSATSSTSVTFGVTDGSFARLMGAMLDFGTTGAMITQSAYRFGLDDGTESGHGWEAAENTPITVATGTRRLLRVQLNETGGADNTAAYTLQYKRSDEGDDQWRDL